jgi:hypothetical protein
VAGFHIIMAMLCTCRLTEIVVIDDISKPIRKRFAYKFFTCTRCVSVWAGLLATVLYFYFPWGNWPFGLSMFYLIQNSMAMKFLRIK